jgi:ribosomal protein L29
MFKRSEQEKSAATELETAKMEAMKARFRKVLGESVSSHVVQGIRRKIAECTRTLNGGKNADCSTKAKKVKKVEKAEKAESGKDKKDKKNKRSSVRGENA